VWVEQGVVTLCPFHIFSILRLVEIIMLKYIISGQHKDVLGINQRNLDYVYPNNARQYFKSVDEKLLAKVIFKKANIPFPETYHLFQSFRELIDFENQLEPFENFVIKPNKGKAGNGIIVLGKKILGGYENVRHDLVPIKKIRRNVADILLGVYSYGMDDSAMVEKRIFPAPFLNQLFTHGLSDIRFIYYQENPVMGMIRVPTEKSFGKANLHQGGIGIGFDLKTGVTNHATFNQQSIKTHPDSEAELIGLQVPELKELLRMCQSVASLLPLKYLGFDLTLDEEHGPMMIEVNARPGLEIQNINQKGLLGVLG